MVNVDIDTQVLAGDGLAEGRYHICRDGNVYDSKLKKFRRMNTDKNRHKTGRYFMLEQRGKLKKYLVRKLLAVAFKGAKWDDEVKPKNQDYFCDELSNIVIESGEPAKKRIRVMGITDSILKDAYWVGPFDTEEEAHEKIDILKQDEEFFD